MKKNQILLGAAAIFGAALIVGQSLAYFTDNDEVTNTFTVGDLDIEETEPEWDDQTDGKNLTPGSTKYKNPTVKNVTSAKNGEEPGYVRMIVEVRDGSGNAVTDPEALRLIWSTVRFDQSYTGSSTSKGAATGLTEDKVPGYTSAEIEKFPMVNPLFTKDDTRSTASRYVWNYMGPQKDGLLQIGEEAALFTNVVIPSDWNQTHLEKVGNFILDISAEAIQSKGFASQSDAFKALDGEVQGGTIQTRK